MSLLDPTRPVRGCDPMAGIFELKTTAADKFLFNLKAGNGEVILTSQQYEAKSSAENGIESVRRNAPLDERFERKTSKAGRTPEFAEYRAANRQCVSAFTRTPVARR